MSAAPGLPPGWGRVALVVAAVGLLASGCSSRVTYRTENGHCIKKIREKAFMVIPVADHEYACDEEDQRGDR